MRVRSALFAILLLTVAVACNSRIGPNLTHPAQPTAAPIGSEHFALLLPGVAASSQPSPDQLREAKELGYRSIVNLRTVKEGAAAERLVVQELGMVYENIPVEGTQVTFEAAEAMMNSVPLRLRPALIHCSSGNRVGALWALYSFKHGGDSVEEALAAGEAAGMKHPRMRKVVERRLRSK